MNHDQWVDIILVAAGPLRHRKLRELVTEVLGSVHDAGADDGIRFARAAVRREVYECLERGEECNALLRALDRLGRLPDEMMATCDPEKTVEITRPTSPESLGTP